MAKQHPYTQLTLKLYREQGYECQKVERWCTFSNRRIDLFDVIDIVAVADGVTVGIQCTSASGRSARRTKILGSRRAWRWVRGGNLLTLCTWRKSTLPGSKRIRWVPTLENFNPEDWDEKTIEDEIRDVATAMTEAAKQLPPVKLFEDEE